MDLLSAARELKGLIDDLPAGNAISLAHKKDVRDTETYRLASDAIACAEAKVSSEESTTVHFEFDDGKVRFTRCRSGDVVEISQWYEPEEAALYAAALAQGLQPRQASPVDWSRGCIFPRI